MDGIVSDQPANLQIKDEIIPLFRRDVCADEEFLVRFAENDCQVRN